MDTYKLISICIAYVPVLVILAVVHSAGKKSGISDGFLYFVELAILVFCSIIIFLTFTRFDANLM